MKQHLNLSIPTPCGEKWETFTPTTQGGYCGNCSKVVIDFTKMSDDEIIEYFKDRPRNACGRFRPEQLTTYHYKNQVKSPSPSLTLFKASVVSFFMLLFSKEMLAQVKLKESKIENRESILGLVAVPYLTKNSFTTVSGFVKDSLDSTAFQGASIILKGTTQGTSTDEHGHFTFEGNLKTSDILEFSFIGYKTIDYNIADDGEINIFMEPDIGVLGGITLGGVSTTRKISFRRWWWKLKELFY